jgi:HlyD family secretion protein
LRLQPAESVFLQSVFLQFDSNLEEPEIMIGQTRFGDKVGLKPWTLGLAAAAVALTGGMVYFGITQFGRSPTPSSSTTAPLPLAPQITTLGRLEPEAEVIQLSAPLTLDGDRLSALRVREGDPVKQGQVIAILDSYSRLAAVVQQSQEQVRVAQSQLQQVRAGAKTGEIRAQEAQVSRLAAELQGELATQSATIARLKAEVGNAQREYQRFGQLYQEGAISASALDSRRLTLETATAQLREAEARQSRTAETLKAQQQEARATLNRIAEVRPVDIQVAQTRVDEAMAALGQAQVNLEQALVRAPMNGQILKIHTRVGEKISDQGIADLGQTRQMVAVAEVYQTDIGRIKLGQPAVLTSPAFSGKLRGEVSQIGLQVNRQNVFSNQPGENLDRRVIEVKIRLTPEDSLKVAGLTNLQVQTAIEVQSNGSSVQSSQTSSGKTSSGKTSPSQINSAQANPQ